MAIVGKTFRSSLSAVNRPATTTIVSRREALKDAFTFRHCGPDIAVHDLVRLRKFDKCAEISQVSQARGRIKK